MEAELKQKRLVLVSNGEPYKHVNQNQEIKQEKLAGGLTTGLDPMMQEDNGLWIAWGRGEADFKVVNQENKVKVPDENGYTLKRIQLSEEEKNGFYYGFSNEVMWPISHTFISKANYKKEYWQSYKKVNQKYADSVKEELQEDDLVWIHDYHLALLPGLLAESSAKTSLFWHIPWPAWEAFRTIPWREEILEGMLAADFLAFHTDSFVYNFIDCAKKLGADVNFSTREIYYQGSKTRVESIPLGIDYHRFHQLAEDEEYLEKARNIKQEYSAEKLVFAVDRLDYTKGIEERLEGIDRFFEKYPEYQCRVTFVQRVAPSRTGIEEYQQMKERIEKKVAEINGKYQKDRWQPVKYFYGSVPQEELLPYYKVADLALITASIDGMNLVAKEYLAVQDSGVLLLSEFAGAAEYLDSAIKVNPYDVEAVADSIYQGLEMPESEKKERLKKAQADLKEYDINWWRDTFLEKWLDSYE
ncbi:trehalose 6-phosphate synthase [Halanaerobium saccharolyticum]|uniref:Trehalose 6-phosphate synthase n=1 Tax=Halanaerobium saccharolyticum TaxID=43595 RepID=A0A4R7YSC0_9FIRM|nr:trehalose-6-phosphate synthase [Halanaerobium saccharolyticum]RAK06325.1 trehalose 6-phosphate synthase [Halanaerobium saccharolyticum]TDW00637.1 trehalose 6-phosphate synthase [Halanaerobium saccharolyticum]TDX52250.1 trehalose 6-phosphate synthase [Halanaerobium saccharolyticum]